MARSGGRYRTNKQGEVEQVEAPTAPRDSKAAEKKPATRKTSKKD